jgi:hypothetical protein
MTGAVVSETVKLVLHMEVLPAASATVMTIVVAPRPAAVPAAGDCVIEATPQLSAATTPDVKSGTKAVQLSPAEADWAPAQVVITGAVASTTVNVAVHVLTLPELSVTVMVTGVPPTPTELPAAGDCVTVATPQLSPATTPAVKSGTSAAQFESAFTVWSAAQLAMLGAVVSETVNTTVCCTELPLPSATVSVTVVPPRPTAVPASGDCVTVTDVQLSVATTWLA